MILLALAASAAGAPSASASFDPLAFFAGRTEGAARLKVVLHATRAVHVHGTGRRQRDGSLVLDQRVEQEGKPATSRRWVLRRVAPGRYAGTLTDAQGPVTADATGDRLHIAYRSKDGLAFEQWLRLANGGRVARNHLTAKKFGVVVARLDETIRKID